MAVDALQVGLEGHIYLAVLVTGDGYFIPLVRALMKQGIRVAVAYFEYETENHRSFINDRLLTVCNYAININALERDKKYQPMFKSCLERTSPKVLIRELIMTGGQSNDRNSAYNTRTNPFNVKRPHRRLCLWRALPARVRERDKRYN